MEEIQNKDNQDPNQIPELSEEEKQAEEAALKETPDEEIRSKVIEDFGFDEDIDKENIDKVVAERQEAGKKLSTAIKQKIKHREAAKAAAEKKKEEAPEGPPSPEAGDKDDDVINKKLDAKFQERDLETLGVSEELTKEIKSYAELHKCSIKKAFDSEYIQFRKGKEDEAAAAEDASLGGGGHTAGAAKKDPSTVNPSKDFDLSTEEGRAAHDEWKKKHHAQEGA